MKKTIRLSISLILTFIFLFLFLHQIDVFDIIETMKNANLSLLCIAIVVFFIGYACRIERWRIMLTQENANISWQCCAGPMMASIAANNVIPFRAGDLIRAFAFNKRLGISATTSITTLVVERLLDLLMIVLFFGGFLIYFGVDSSKYIGIGGIAVIIVAILIFTIILFPSFFKLLAFKINKIINNVSPRLGGILQAELEKVFLALEYMSKGHIMSKLLMWSFVAWTAEGCVFWLVALSLPLITNDLAAWLSFAVGTLSTAIPSSPGYVGTFDYFTAQSMIALKNSPAASTAFAFLVHAIIWIPVTIAGGVYILIRPIQSLEKGSL